MAHDNPQVSTHQSAQLTDGRADHVARQHELEQARVKLLALEGALIDIPGAAIKFRVVETSSERMKLLRVWDSSRGGKSETVACLKLPEGWRFTAYPHGPVIADADGIQEADDAEAAAKVVAAHVGRLV